MPALQGPSILVIDDHPVFRAGMVAVLGKLDCAPTVTEAGSLAEAWSVLRKTPPSCATLDLQLADGNGFSLLSKALREGISTRFVVVSLFDDDALRARACGLGADGFVPKEHDLETIAETVSRVLSMPPRAGSVPAPPPTVSLERHLPLLGVLSRLTPAERRVLRLLSRNQTSPQIAEQLGLSPRTVQNHRAHICEKLGLRGSHRLLAAALELRDALPDEDGTLD